MPQRKRKHWLHKTPLELYSFLSAVKSGTSSLVVIGPNGERLGVTDIKVDLDYRELRLLTEPREK